MAEPGIGAITIWLTGLSGAGKSALARHLCSAHRACVVLDGDDLRQGLSSDLGFSRADRRENVRRTAEVAKLLNRSGLPAIVALVSPYQSDRSLARDIVGEERFLEVYVSTALSVCERRDVKGLYARARAGAIGHFTGISDPYEPPMRADVTLDLGVMSLEQSASAVLRAAGRLFPTALALRESNHF